MPKTMSPRGYMTRYKRLDLYDRNLKFIGTRTVYKYGNNYYIIKANNKAYQVGVKLINNKPLLMEMPNGITKGAVSICG